MHHSSSLSGFIPRILACALALTAFITTTTYAGAASLAITTKTVPDATGGVPYSQSLAATGGTAPYAWKVQSGSFAPGLTLSSAGLLAGTPTAATWIYNYPLSAYVKVTDANGATAYASIPMKVVAPGSTPAPAPEPTPAPTPDPTPAPAPAPLAITTSTLPVATGGVPYSQSLAGSGGTPPYAWTVQSGSFAPGLTLSSSGLLAGTPTAATWIYSYPLSAYVKLTDSTGATTFKSIPMKVQAPDGTVTPPPATNPPPTPTPTYTVTVVSGTLGANSSSNSATFAAGASVSIAAAPPPAGQSFKTWTASAAVTFTDPTSATTSFVMPSSSVNVYASYFTPVTIPAPVAGHPRLWLNQADIARYRSWAVPSNAIYQQGLRSMLANALHAYALCFPNGQPASPYPDSGDVYGYSGANITSDMVSEQHALTLAFFALIDPSPTARLDYASKARDLYMYVIHQANQPHAAGVPFRDPIFAIYNRSNSAGYTWPLLADWLQGVTDANGQPVTILTAQDRLDIRDCFMRWSEDCLNAYTTGGDHPSPIGVTNSTALLPGGNAMRIAANNYYLNHARLITMMPLALDAADDPVLDATKPVSFRGNSLRSYLALATGAWLYQQYAMFGDPTEVRAAYNLPATASVGLASGGTAAEGGLYGHSVGFILGQLLALQSTGITDPSFCGPQISLLGSPVWDKYVHGYLAQLVPQQQVDPSQSYLGPVYQIANFGDVIRIWATPNNMIAFALLALTEQKQGRADHLAAARWIALHAVEGGAAGLLTRIQRPYDTLESMLYFMLFDPTDPTALTPADPRPSYSANYYDPGMGRLLSRTDWTPNGTLLDFRSGWLSINHQNCDGGQFQFYRKGEWLTKELSNYDNYGNGQSTIWHNTLALQNWCASSTPFMQWFEQPYWTHGSQWNNHQSAGDPATIAATGPGYAVAHTDMTNLFNHPSSNVNGNFTDITHASRTLVWLQPDTIVVYDRATSLHAGFKRFNLTTPTTPIVDAPNHRATITTAKGQHFFVQTLLPANATLTYIPEGGSLTNIAQLEHSTGRLEIEDPAKPAATRFLHVLQAADAVVTAADPTAVVASSAGTSYEGALVLDTVVLFARDLSTAFTSVTYTVPDTTAHHYVANLSPNSGYTVTTAATPGWLTVTITPGGPATTDAAGLLRF